MQSNSQRKFLIAGNWKMQGSKAQTQALILGLNEGLSNGNLTQKTPMPEVIICPSYGYLSIAENVLSTLKSTIQLGAQDLSVYPSGAYTGQVSGLMLKDLGCRYVLVGHSERRQYCGETNELVADKFFAAKNSGLIPILCLGETLADREKNNTESVVKAQLHAVLSREGAQGLNNAIIAYEPVWAIGTGKTASPEEAQSVHQFLRKMIADQNEKLANVLQIVYGGSVKANNAVSLFAMPDIDGALVGGASLDASEFLSICQSAC